MKTLPPYWKILSFVLLIACLVLDPADCVVPRRYRTRYRSSDLQSRARFALGGAHLPTTTNTEPTTTVSRGRENSKFRPTITRCCKVGEKTARKRLSCDLADHGISRRYNFVNKAKMDPQINTRTERSVYTKVLTAKMEKCMSSKYSNNFLKCCRYREDYYREMDACRVHKGLDRKFCRKEVRGRYP